MKSASNVGRFVIFAAIAWACLPKPGYETTWESLKNHAYFIGHLLGWLPAARPRTRLSSVGIPRGSPGSRAANGTILEVQGFVDAETFKSKYLYTDPVVFRSAATKQNGFNLECLTGTNRSLQEEMARHMGNTRIRVFADSYDDGSASMITVKEYEEMAKRAQANSTMPLPYPRAFPQGALGKTCVPIPDEKLQQYHGMFSTASMLAEGGKALVFYSLNKGTTTKMHMDVGDSLFTQVYGRKKWSFVDPAYATTMQTYAERMNLFYSTGFDVHLESIPAEVPIREVILHPGDVVYFPSMMFHAISNLDDVTLGIDQPCMDFGGALRRHWLCAICTFLNPWMIIKVIKQFLATGTIKGDEVYFDKDNFAGNSGEVAAMVNKHGS